jgi:hypothetical protein
VSVNVVAVIEVAVSVAAAAAAAFPFVVAVLAVVDVGVLHPISSAVVFSSCVSGCFCRCDSRLLLVLGLLVRREVQLLF